MEHLYIGLAAEGNTDYRFLLPIIEKTFIKVAFECKGQIDISVDKVEFDKGKTFNDFALNAAKKAKENYRTILVLHADADNASASNVYENKIRKAIKTLLEQPDNEVCKNIVALVPIQETEAWMLADKALFKESINATKSDAELNISGHPETFNNPKLKIQSAIAVGCSHLPKKVRKRITIDSLYKFLGVALDIEQLNNFESFIDFERNIRNVMSALNLLQN